MLGSFRKASQSFVAKIFFGLLVLTFVGWGIGDVFRTRFANQPGIVVGDTKIAPETVAAEFRRDADRLQRMSGGKINIDQARQMGFLNQTVQRLVSQSLLDEENRRLGLAIDPEAEKREVASIPAFRNQLGAFDAQQMRQVLRANNMTEAGFWQMEKDDLERNQLTEMVTGGVTVPDAMTKAIFGYRNEQRALELIPFPASGMSMPAPPDDATLAAYHKDHAAQFTSPERRTLTALVLKGSDLVADYKPTDDQVAKAYQDRQSDFMAEETRHLQQVFFAEEGDAKKFADAVKGGASFADAAKAAGKEVDDLGSVAKKQLPLPAIADAAFAADAPGLAGPVKTPLGWNVIDVVDKSGGTVRPLAEVRDQIVADLTKEETANRLTAASNKLDDSIGSGASLDEAAATVGTKLIKIDGIDANGNGADGKPVAGAPDSAAFRTEAFKLAKGASSDVDSLEKDEGYFVVRVDDITAPALKPLDTVKADVIAAWSKDEQLKEAMASAQNAAELLGKGENPQKVAGAKKFSVSTAFTRNGNDQVPAPMAAEAFKLKLGEATAFIGGDTAFAMRLAAIVPADPNADRAAFEQVRDKLKDAIAGDLDQQYMAALSKDIGVDIRRNAIEQQFSQ